MITEESFVDFKCPYCGETISFPGENAGYAQACPCCTESVIVPADSSGEGKKLPLPVRTPRLVLRRFTGADWHDLLECLADEELYRYMEGAPLEEDEVLRWLERDSQVKLTTPEQVFYLGIQLEEGKLIGYVSLSASGPFQVVLQVVLNQAHRGQGLAREAVEGVLGFCFQGIKQHRVVAWCDGRNAAARKLFAGAGFRCEGEFVKSKLFNGEWVNMVYHAVLEEEFQRGSAAGEAGGGEQDAESA